MNVLGSDDTSPIRKTSTVAVCTGVLLTCVCWVWIILEMIWILKSFITADSAPNYSFFLSFAAVFIAFALPSQFQMTSWIWTFLQREINVALKIPPPDDIWQLTQTQVWKMTF